MVIHWVAMTYDVVRDKTTIYYNILHDVNAILSWRASIEPITVDFHMFVKLEEFMDGCCTVIIVTFDSTVWTQVSLT